MTVKEMRQSRHMTQEALAEAAGCSRITIARMEAGRTPVTLKILNGLSRAFGVSVTEIVEMLNESETNDGSEVTTQ
ncbi:MAG: helix-turn-helix transcriptional regulator [bacterium]